MNDVRATLLEQIEDAKHRVRQLQEALARHDAEQSALDAEIKRLYDAMPAEEGTPYHLAWGDAAIAMLDMPPHRYWKVDRLRCPADTSKLTWTRSDETSCSVTGTLVLAADAPAHLRALLPAVELHNQSVIAYGPTIKGPWIKCLVRLNVNETAWYEVVRVRPV